jgi:hypothetical protein
MVKFGLSVMAGPHYSAKDAAASRRAVGRFYIKSGQGPKGVGILYRCPPGDGEIRPPEPIFGLARNLQISLVLNHSGHRSAAPPNHGNAQKQGE